MIKNLISKACVAGLILANGTGAFAGAMGDVQDDSKHFMFSVSALYGRLSDGTLEGLNYSDVATNRGIVGQNTLNFDSRWGYDLSVGYQFGPNRSHSVVLSYSNLENKGFAAAATGSALDTMQNNLGVILAGFDDVAALRAPASAVINSYIKYQSADLIANRNYASAFVDQIHFSRYFGAKAAEFKKGFDAQINGITQAPVFGFVPSPSTDTISYNAKYYGLGPKAGAGASWAINRYLSIGGDISLALIAGSKTNNWDEIYTTTDPAGSPFLPVSSVYTYSQRTSGLWVSPVLGANLVVSTQYEMASGSSVGLEGGLSSEQYWSQNFNDKFGTKRSVNKTTVNERFALRNAFIKLNYVC